MHQKAHNCVGDAKGKIIERKKAKVLRFYPHMILCEVDRNKECFTYNDLNSLTAYSKKKEGDDG